MQGGWSADGKAVLMAPNHWKGTKSLEKLQIIGKAPNHWKSTKSLERHQMMQSGICRKAPNDAIRKGTK